MGKIKFKRENWETFKKKLWKKGFEIALTTETEIEVCNFLLPKGFSLVKHDGFLWLKIPPLETKIKLKKSGGTR